VQLQFSPKAVRPLLALTAVGLSALAPALSHAQNVPTAEIFDLNGLWQGNINPPRAEELIVTLRINQQGEHVAVLHMDGLPAGPGQQIFAGTYQAGQIVGEVAPGAKPSNHRIAIDDPDDWHFTDSGWKFHRASNPVGKDLPCEISNPYHVTIQGALVRGYLLNTHAQYQQSNCWYYISANLGSVDGTEGIAYAFYNGQGVKQDYATAFRLFTIAAEHGNPVAQHNLASMYDLGQGTPKDSVAAASWRAKSDAQFKQKEAQRRAQETAAQEAVREQMAPLRFLGAIVQNIAGPLTADPNRSPLCVFYDSPHTSTEMQQHAQKLQAAGQRCENGRLVPSR
jgi:hypothetical protein